MKIMVDTNIIISALVFGGQAEKILHILFESEHNLYISEYIDKEIAEVLKRKWPEKALELYSAYRKMNFNFCTSTNLNLATLRDIKDIPILNDAIYHNIDVILSGDKDFLETDLTKPLICSPTTMLNFLHSQQNRHNL